MKKVSDYRGFEIFSNETGTRFVARRHDFDYGGSFNTAWSAMAYIDELLSP